MSIYCDTCIQRSANIPSSSGRALQCHQQQQYIHAKGLRCRRQQAKILKAFLSEGDSVHLQRKECLRVLPVSIAWLAGTVSAIQTASMIAPLPSFAGETVSVKFLSSFLDNVEHLGPYGPLFYVAVMLGAEMVPLFPTQPLTIASGLLFGGPKGALLALVSTSTAAMLAFQISRKLGEKLAKKAASEELSEDQQTGIFAKVQSAVESGSFQQQVVAVTLLRLTPVVPFSATNYLLGTTPLQFPAYVAGSLAGLSFWCSIYASLGAAGRELLKGGVSLDVLFEDLTSKAGSYTEDAAIVMGVLGILTAAYVKFGPQTPSSSDKQDKHKEKQI